MCDRKGSITFINNKTSAFIQEPAVKKIRILIVEDDFIVAKVIEKSLISLDYAIVGLVATGEEAIALAESEKPDLILMDIRLQGKMDGIKASEKIHDTLHIPVIFLTAFSDQKMFERALATAPYGYIIKPFSANTLSTTIRVALEKKHADIIREERNFWLDSTISSLPEGIITVNGVGKVLLFNQTAERMTGWKNKEVYELPLENVLTFVDSITNEPFHYNITPVLLEGVIGTIPIDSFVLSKDMTHHLLDDSLAIPIRDNLGEISGAAIVLYPRTLYPTWQKAQEPDRTDTQVREVSITFETDKIRSFEPATATPRDAIGWYDRGNYLLFQRQYSEAISAYSNAISMNQMNYQSWYGKGTALAKLNRIDEALATYEQALLLLPRNSRILNAKGVLLKKIGREADADRCFELARLYSA
jgi:CheY-like chemotaxis protein